MNLLRAFDLAELQALEKQIQTEISSRTAASSIEDKSVNDIGLERRSANALLREDIKTVGDLLPFTELELLCMPSLGRHSLRNIKETLAVLGLNLKPQGPKVDNRYRSGFRPLDAAEQGGVG